MKLFLLTAFLLLFILKDIKAQYTVIRFVGKVTYKEIKINGRKELDTTSINFFSLKDTLVVRKGGAIIQLTKNNSNKLRGKSSLREFAYLSFRLNSTSGALSGRGEIIEKIPDALQPSSNSNGKVILQKEN